jgi:Subtilase family/Viral BACON domain/Putative binding domain, N-terminal
MTKKFHTTLALILAISFLALAQIEARPQRHEARPQAAPYVDGELLVKTDRLVSAQSLANANRKIGAVKIQDFDLIGWQRVRLPEGLSVKDAIALYSSMPDVVSAQPNYIYRISVVPNDASFGSLYGMAKIQAPAAWDSTTGSAAVIVAVLDTGIRHTHEDLGANVWQNPGEVAGNSADDDGNGFVDDVIGYDFINNDSNPLDDDGHGTHVSGTIGAVGNNSMGVVGVNWNVRIMAIKTHDADGNSTAAAVISAFQYVTMMKSRGVNIRVTSNSWGGAPEAPAYDQALKDAIDAAGDAGIVNVFAAGNNARDIDSSPAYPASYTSSSIISVASSNSLDDRSPFSNYGAAGVDLAAPGSSILSTYFFNDSDYQTLSGTSMATPHVAGAVALLAAANPSLTAQALKDTILNSVDVLPQWAGVVLTGGRLNVARAIETTCSYTVEAADAYFEMTGGSGNLTITSANNCGWAVAGKPDWIDLSQGSGDGSATINYAVAANTTGISRQAQMTLAGTVFTVVQDGGTSGDCEIAASPSRKTFGASGGSGVITINAGPRCSWKAASNENWITFTTSGAGVGDQTLSFTVAANPGTSRRKATITVGGTSFNIKQKAN